jgi:hypothetical protein
MGPENDGPSPSTGANVRERGHTSEPELGNEQFQHEYDLAALTLVRPRGLCFSMSVALRCREHYENFTDCVEHRVWQDFQT